MSYKLIDGLNTIGISGSIIIGDAAKFTEIADSITGKAVVMLSSNGGAIIDGLSIGQAIHKRGYATLVFNGRTCASACGLIWLGGTDRYIGRTGRVGFHAAYMSDDKTRESGAGNALVGAYLSTLGLSYDAIYYLTEKAPNDIQWLNADDAKQFGIQWTMMADPTPPPTQAQVPAGSTVAQRIMGLVASYYTLWSQPGTNVDGMSQYYADTVSFYGGAISRAKVMDEKRKFSERWPIRKYAVKTSTLFVQCTDTCAVSGVVEWDVRSIERGAHSVGAANFVLKIAPLASAIGGLIVSENGSVLANQVDTAPAMVGGPPTTG